MNKILLYIAITVVLLFIIYKIFIKPASNETTTTSAPTTSAPTTSAPTTSAPTTSRKQDTIVNVINTLNPFSNTEHFADECTSVSSLECYCKDVKLSTKAEINNNIPCLLNLIYDIYLMDADDKKYIEDYYKEMTGKSILNITLPNIDPSTRNRLFGDNIFTYLVIKNNIKWESILRKLLDLSIIPIAKLEYNLQGCDSILYYTKCNDSKCITTCGEEIPLGDNLSPNTTYMKLIVNSCPSTTTNKSTENFTTNCDDVLLDNTNTTADYLNGKVEVVLDGINYTADDVIKNSNMKTDIFDLINNYVQEQNLKYANPTVPNDLNNVEMMGTNPSIIDYYLKIVLKTLVYNLYLLENGINREHIYAYENAPTTTAKNIDDSVLTIKNAIINDIINTFKNFIKTYPDLFSDANKQTYSATYKYTKYDGTKTSNEEGTYTSEYIQVFKSLIYFAVNDVNKMIENILNQTTSSNPSTSSN